jgi:hypothetical protein
MAAAKLSPGRAVTAAGQSHLLMLLCFCWAAAVAPAPATAAESYRIGWAPFEINRVVDERAVLTGRIFLITPDCIDSFFPQFFCPGVPGIGVTVTPVGGSTTLDPIPPNSAEVSQGDPPNVGPTSSVTGTGSDPAPATGRPAINMTLATADGPVHMYSLFTDELGGKPLLQPTPAAGPQMRPSTDHGQATHNSTGQQHKPGPAHQVLSPALENMGKQQQPPPVRVDAPQPCVGVGCPVVAISNVYGDFAVVISGSAIGSTDITATATVDGQQPTSPTLTVNYAFNALRWNQLDPSPRAYGLPVGVPVPYLGGNLLPLAAGVRVTVTAVGVAVQLSPHVQVRQHVRSPGTAPAAAAPGVAPTVEVGWHGPHRSVSGAIPAAVSNITAVQQHMLEDRPPKPLARTPQESPSRLSALQPSCAECQITVLTDDQGV